MAEVLARIIDSLRESSEGCQGPKLLTAFAKLQAPKTCSGVPESVMNPANAWADKEDFDSTLRHLADLYNDNFTKYASGGGFVSKDLAARIVGAGPKGQQRVLKGKISSNGNV